MKVVCIDDERLALEFIERQLNKMKNVEIIGLFQHPIEGLNYILTEEVDVVFLDIELPGLNGIELAEKIFEEKSNIIIVFVTAYNEFAVKAFELNAIDYIVKPIKYERLRMTVERINKKLHMDDKLIEKTNVLHIHVSNSLQFKDVDQNSYPIKWRTNKSRELFLYLLQNHGQLVQKATLIELLWNEVDYDKGYSILYTTVYNVRNMLKKFSDHIILQNENEGYVLQLNNVEIDLFAWEEKVINLPAISETTVEQHEKVMELNKGRYLDDYDYIWIEPEKQRLEQIWHFKAHELANYYEGNDDLHNAIRWYSNICNRMPEIEEAHLSLMKLYERQGNEKLIIDHYTNLMETYRHFSLQPSKEIVKWYENRKKR